MRTLLVIHDFLPDTRAGSELYTYYLAKELARAGISVELFFAEAAAERSVERRVYDSLPCTVLRKPFRRPVNIFADEDPWADEAFRQCLERFEPDVVHINHLLFLSLNIPGIAKSRGHPVLFTLHDYWLTCPRITRLDHLERPCRVMSPSKCTLCCRPVYSRFAFEPAETMPPLAMAKLWAKLMYTATLEMPGAYTRLRGRAKQVRDLGGLVDLWISPSLFLEEIMIAYGLPRERIIHLPNGLPTSHLTARRHRSRSGRLHFGFLGTVARYKGIHVLLEAFRGIRDADLTVWGGQVHAVPEQCRDVLEQENVRFPGVITDDEKTAALSSLDALVVPSIWFENAPLVILEALVCGVPVVASDIGGMKELVRVGETGLLFRTGSAADLRRLLESCIEQPARIRGLRVSGRNVMTIEAHAEALLSIYRRLSGSRVSSP